MSTNTVSNKDTGIEQLFKPAAGRVDWLEAKSEYVTNRTITYADIAAKHKVSLKQVKKHGSNEDWTRSRQKVTETTELRITESFVDERVAATERHLKLWQQAINLLELQFNVLTANMEQKQARAKYEGRDLDEKELLSPAKLLCLTKALTIAINGQRITLGLPTKITAAPGYNLEAERVNELANMSEEELREYIAQLDTQAVNS